MEDKKVTNGLKELAIAALIGEGEFDNYSSGPVLKVPLDRKKTLYLIDIIKNKKLKDHVTIEPDKGQFSIHSHNTLNTLKEQWYKDNRKIFSMILDPKLINLQSIIISINLFGDRKLETISIPTNVDREHIKAISYCVEHHLQVPVIPSPNSIKITDIPTFVLNSVNDISAIHSVELLNYLTDKEKKSMMEGAV
ncbi:hypothetical protein AWM68_17800 [Fictibacillus phosphorivorans]|uniref:Uncharacterized protein n=1 Tax=Fictibacillus phosphorivorans TaxID=1221500 RepID=A0A163S2W5_9BACL|nr:hypothetical protein [Fictibacillus phosphorivorans]KZE68024.1 hypothetical protein AWM68_17800 [Fictibacillus phosphorivorans]